MSSITFCENCGKTETETTKLLKCSRCKTSRYCQKECQVSHWPIHKKYCKKLSSKEYNVKSNKNSIPLGDEMRNTLVNTQESSVREVIGDGMDVRLDREGNFICQFLPSITEDSAFYTLLFENASVNVKEKYGFDAVSGGGIGEIADESPTNDHVKLIMQSIISLMAPAEEIPGVIILSEEDKFYLLMKNGRKFVKTIPPNIEESMSSVIKVEFCMANSNVKMVSFLGDLQKCQVFHAKDKDTIVKLKTHLEKNATRTGKEIQCIRGVSKIYEGYLDMQNLD